MAKKTPPPSSPADKLDVIIEYLYRIDKRDRLRMWGGFFRGMLALLPTALLIATVWYLYFHGDEFLSTISAEAAEQAAKMMQGGGGFLDYFQMSPPR